MLSHELHLLIIPALQHYLTSAAMTGSIQARLRISHERTSKSGAEQQAMLIANHRP